MKGGITELTEGNESVIHNDYQERTFQVCQFGIARRSVWSQGNKDKSSRLGQKDSGSYMAIQTVINTATSSETGSHLKE